MRNNRSPVVISSNAVLPPARSGLRRAPKTSSWTFFAPILKQCVPGDTFFIPTTDVRLTAIKAHTYASFRRSKGERLRITVRSTVENNMRGLRIWRIV